MHEPTRQNLGGTTAADDRRDPPPTAARARPVRLFADRYEIRSRLGAGGMAEVVLARDTTLGRLVALKLLAPALAADPVFVERFRREATAIASLSHANVVVIYDHGVVDGQPYIAMEHVPGRTLKELVAAGAPLAPAVAAGYVRQTLAGLAAAHAVGIVHRDVKPQNLIVRDDGTLKVADFGVARAADETVLTQHGSVIGTADYISPEQARGESATFASDLYSVGVMLFELLTGTLPFVGELPLAIANQHVSAPPPSLLEIAPGVPATLANVVRRALSKDPALRHSGAAEMAAALDDRPADAAGATLVAPTVRMPATAPATRVMPQAAHAATRLAPRRRRWGAAAAALALAALLIGVAFAIATRGDAGARRVTLPRLVGTPVASAASALRARGLNPRVAEAVHAVTRSGTVAAVRPSVTSAALGTTITIVPSAGPKPVAVPVVAGLTQEQALAALADAGLQAQPRTAYGAVPAGIAIATTPSGGEEVPPHSSVVVTISAGPAPATPAKPTPAPGKAKGDGPPKAKGHGKGKHHGGD